MSGTVFVSPYNPVQQSGCRAKNPPDMVVASAAPTTKSIGYLNGTFWLYVGHSLWFLESQVGGASPSANWVQLTTASGGVLPVSQGGTGRSTLTAHGVLVGEGTSAVNITSAGTLGQPLVSGGASVDPAFAVLGVVGGGTGVATLTGIPLASGTSAFSALTYVAPTSWTPALLINGSATGITYSNQTGFYTRIANVVFFNANIALTSKGASVGTVTLSNLPVTTGANGGQNVIDVIFTNVTLAATYSNIAMNLNNASATGTFNQYGGTSSSFTGLTNSELADTSILEFSGMYLVN